MGLVTSILPNGQIDIIAEGHVTWYLDGTELEMFHVAIDPSGSSLSLTWSFLQKFRHRSDKDWQSYVNLQETLEKFDVLDDVLNYDETLPGRATLYA